MRSSMSSLFVTTLILLSSLSASAAYAVDPPSLTMTISGPQTATAGDDIIISVVLKNVSNRIIPLWLGDPYTVLVHNESGEGPTRKSGGRAGSAISASIEPGKTLTDFPVNLISEYDLSVPGKYGFN
jgi:hypothetical protein